MRKRLQRPAFWLVVALLLLIAASRILRLADFETDKDDRLSLNRALGDTPAEVIRSTPDDWPPLYYLLLSGWRQVVGMQPLVLRVLSALTSMLGFAFMAALMRRLGGERAALLATLAYAAFAEGIFLDVKLRGYFIIHALLPLALWLTVRYFHRPNLRRALPLALTLAVMFYTTFISGLVFVAIGVYTLAIYGRAVWRWWLPGVLAGALALPEIAAKLTTIYTKATFVSPKKPLLEAMADLFHAHTGGYEALWLALIALAIALMLYRRSFSRRAAVLLVWIVVLPLLMYFFLDALFVQWGRYSLFVPAGIALLLGWELAGLPRPVYAGIVAIFAVLLFAPFEAERYRVVPFDSNMIWLRDHLRAGDVVVVDSRCECPEAWEWNYFIRAYFPHSGLQFVDDPAGYRRVWYVRGRGDSDPALRRAVEQNRVPGIFVGPAEFFFRLYEAPPDADGIAFENGMRFHGFDVIEDTPWAGERVMQEGQTLRLRLWWSADHPPEQDYSVGVYLMQGGAVVAQVDGAPQVVPPETSRWTPGEYYVEARELTMPLSGVEREYDLMLAVYQYWDGVKIPAPGATDDNGLLRLFPLNVRTS